MKKLLILSLFITLCLLNFNSANAEQSKNNDYEIVQTEEVSETAEPAEVKTEVIEETDVYRIDKIGNKYAFFNKNINKYAVGPVVDFYNHFGDKENEFKIVVNNLVGYLNISTNENFFTQFEDMTLLDKYIKVKQNDKYGLLDKSGKIILQPAFQKITIINSQGEEYISAGNDGKYRIFKYTGELVPDNQLYNITVDGSYALANDLQPLFKASYINSKRTLYEKAEYDSVYEIQELELPKKVKVRDISNEIKNAKPVNNDFINIDGKDYILTKDNDKLGLNTKNGKEIIPAVYDELKAIKPCKHFKKSVIIAKSGNEVKIYNRNGKIIADGNRNDGNIYMFGKTYNYTLNNKDNVWLLSQKNKQLGSLKLTDDKDKFEFTKTSFTFRNLHKVNEILLTLINS